MQLRTINARGRTNVFQTEALASGRHSNRCALH